MSEENHSGDPTLGPQGQTLPGQGQPHDSDNQAQWWQPPDWWRCQRFGGVSGRYNGKMTAPGASNFALDLRVDIDSRHGNSPVMNRVSGDIYQVYEFTWFGHTYSWQVYKESWIVDRPSVSWSRCSVSITGAVRYWQGIHLATDVSITIPWNFGGIGPAAVTFNSAGGGSSYSCTMKSSAFRDVGLEIDICKSVNAAPTVPSYDTHSHPDRPVDLPQRVLTIESAYQEAGIDLEINPDHTIIDDSAAELGSWSPAELHDAMEQHFSKYPGTWPKWQMWCLLAGRFDNPGVGGIMFDAAAAFGGAGEAPERQGCAVFRNHSWFNDLVSSPGNDTQDAAMRKFLYTYVHEIGHAFNFLHSWDKGRPDALSWMNYDWKYDNRNGADTFWGDFRMRFDDEELLHLRHGDRAAVIMGGDPWSSGGHLEAPPSAMAAQQGNAPIELLVRSKGHFQFMEPVNVELRLKNLTGIPIDLDSELDPEFGGVVVYIQRPDGRIQEYSPILCKLATPSIKTLSPGVEGDDRHSQSVSLSYGSNGFYFDQPGRYLVRALYQGGGELLITSNVHQVTVGHPYSREEERNAQDFFSHQTGMALYLRGSSSPYLEKGMEVLQEMADRYKDNAVGAHVALALAENLARPFHRIEKGKLRLARDTQAEAALDLTAGALRAHKKDGGALSNLLYHECHRIRARLMTQVGKKAEARKELSSLVRTLARRGVNKPVLSAIKAFAKSL